MNHNDDILLTLIPYNPFLFIIIYIKIIRQLNTLKKYLDEEKGNFDKLDMYKILMRYPLKKFNLLNDISFALKFIDREHYENAVIQALRNNKEICHKIKDLFNDLVQAIEGNNLVSLAFKS